MEGNTLDETISGEKLTGGVQEILQIFKTKTEHISSVIRQKGKSQNGGNKKTKKENLACFFLLPPF